MDGVVPEPRSPEPGGLRVVVADDHVPTRVGIRLALQEDGFAVVAEVGTAAAAVAAAMEHHADVVLLDVHMPGGGISAARTLAAELPSAAVVMLTADRNDEQLFDALRAGARGYLLKDIDPARLGAAVRGAVAGEAAMPRALVARVVQEFSHTPPAPSPRQAVEAALTPRERDVLAGMAEGLSTREIAERLFVSQVTVRTHVLSVLRKLHVSSRDDAVRLLRET